jgi:hypothetical protein
MWVRVQFVIWLLCLVAFAADNPKNVILIEKKPVPKDPYTPDAVHVSEPYVPIVPEQPPLNIPELPKVLRNLKPVTYAGADAYHKSKLELNPKATFSFTPDQLSRPRHHDVLDECLAEYNKQENFMSAIDASVRSAVEPQTIFADDYIRASYLLPPTMKEQMKVSLMSHPLCIQTKEQLRHMLNYTDENGEEHELVPNDETVRRLKEFSEESNRLQASKNVDGFVKHWSQIMGCLGYEESLQTTGEPKGDKEVENNAMFKLTTDKYYEEAKKAFPIVNEPVPPPPGITGDWKGLDAGPDGKRRMYERPPGVQFGEDHDGEYFNKINREIKATRLAADKDLTLDTLDKRAKFINGHMDEFKALLDGTKNELSTFYDPKIMEEYKAGKFKKPFKKWASIGFYQFNPESQNVLPCVNQWNKLFEGKPRCQIDSTVHAVWPGEPKDSNDPTYKAAVEKYANEKRLANGRIMHALSTPGQGFNIWCGVQKVVQSFNTQVNTQQDEHPRKTGVDLDNILDRKNIADSKIKKSGERCVSLAAQGGDGRVYAHFGVFRNSVLSQEAEPEKTLASGLVLPAKPYRPSNMERVMTCTESATKKKI